MVWVLKLDTYRSPAVLLVAALIPLPGCSLFGGKPSSRPAECFASSFTEVQDSVAGVPLIHWHPTSAIPVSACGPKEGHVKTRLNLTGLHGEREFTRRAQITEINGDGAYDIITQTMNQNRVRAIDGTTGETHWVSPLVLPPTEHPPVSDLAVADINHDEKPEAVIASYDGHVLSIDATNGSIQWHKDLDYHIDYPGLQSMVDVADKGGPQLAFTVSRDFEWNESYATPRTNMLRTPSLLALDGDGEKTWISKHYDSHNSRGHWTWQHDLQGDGQGEIIAIGDQKLIVFNSEGDRLFNIPLRNGGHPDDVVFGEWTSEHKGQEIMYTDGIRGIGITSSRGAPIDYLQVPEPLSGHLQSLTFIEKQGSKGPYLLTQNIRSKNAKTTLYDQSLDPLWTAQLGYAAAMQYTKILDWDGDGDREIATGSVSAGMDRQCSLQIMELDGSPRYWHRWRGPQFCWVLDSHDFELDGAEELLLGTGSNGGPQGRWSLAEGSQMNLYVISSN